MDIPYKIEIDPYELFYQIGASKSMLLVMELEDCVNDAKWSQKLILKIISHMSDNLTKEEMSAFIARVKTKAKVK